MKFITVLLLQALAVFSPVLVLSQNVDPLTSASVVGAAHSGSITQKVEPLASASVVGAAHSGSITQKVDPLASASVVRTTTKEADVSPMKNSNDLSIVSFESSAQLTDHTTTTRTPLEESIVDKRGLNGVTCKKFKYYGTGLQFDPYTGPENYVAVDDGVTSLSDWCASGGATCCSGGSYGRECGAWSTEPDTTYEVCQNSCVGTFACYGVAYEAAEGSSISFEAGSCSDTSGNGSSCRYMAYLTTKKVNIRVGENSCTNEDSCKAMARYATNLEELSIQENSCTDVESCYYAASYATSLKYLSIENSCTDDDSCYYCGGDSTFDETLQLTEECCAAVSGEGTGQHLDAACQYIPTCKKFKYYGTGLQFDPYTGPENYVAVDDGVTSLSDWCASNGATCCSGGSYGRECAHWSTEPDTTYEVCQNSCLGTFACYGVAEEALGGSSISFEAGSCSDTSGNGSSCYYMARGTTKKVNIRVGENSCTNEDSCKAMARYATNLEELSIQENSCTDVESCYYAASYATSLKYLSIENSCTDDDSCYYCGGDSTFDETLQLTEECCAAVSGEGTGQHLDAACQYIPYVEAPSPCAGQNCNKAGHCKVTSSTEFTCQCENTFINSANGSCVCPPGFIREWDNRCYDPNTPSPIAITTKAPTSSPNVSNTPAPTSFPSKKDEDDEDEGCNDDENATFNLIRNPNKSVNCSWLSKNKARASKRIANYCDLPRVKTVCKSTCSFCTTCVDDESFTFELTKVSDPNKKNKTCNWLSANNKKRAIRIARYCTEDFDDGAVMNACTKSCGLCE